MNRQILIRGLVASAASLITTTVLAAGGAAGDIEKVDPNEHFHPKGKPPSEHTLRILDEARESMPFDDTRDFDEARKGFIAPLNSMIVEADAGHTAASPGTSNVTNSWQRKRAGLPCTHRHSARGT